MLGEQFIIDHWYYLYHDPFILFDGGNRRTRLGSGTLWDSKPERPLPTKRAFSRIAWRKPRSTSATRSFTREQTPLLAGAVQESLDEPYIRWDRAWGQVVAKTLLHLRGGATWWSLPRDQTPLLLGVQASSDDAYIQWDRAMGSCNL